MDYAENATITKAGTENSVFAQAIIIELMVFVGLAIPILAIMAKIASVTMDSMEMLINVLNVTHLVVLVLDLNKDPA